MNNFGGDWTKTKIEILVEYAQAYLTIMNKYKSFKTLYFDGFAGSGFIEKDKKFGIEITMGAARRIIEIDDPKPFDMYYFVELDPKNHKLLKSNTSDVFPKKKIYPVCGDCNSKLIDLGNYMRKPVNKSLRALVYIDPYGMQVEWRSIETLRDLPIDMWVLVPTGLGVNRLLKKNGHISDAWRERLEKFLGIPSNQIEDLFYKKQQTLFGDESYFKEADAIKKSAELYRKKLKEVFSSVSKPFEIRNKTNSPMYHLYLASNNETAIKIANDIVKKYNK